MFPPFLRPSLDGFTSLGLPKAAGSFSQFAQRVTFGFALACASAGAVGAQTPVALESCAPPAKGEYLLLVVVQADDAEDKLKQTLPPSVKAPACDYLGTRVARMGGFRSPEDADAWASYLRQVASLPAFIAQPPKSGESAAVAPQNLPQSAAQPPSSKAKVSVPALGSEPPLERPAVPAAPTATASGPSTELDLAPAATVPSADSVPKPDLSPRNATTRYPDAAVTVPGPAGSTAAATTAQVPSTGSNIAKATFAPKSLASGYVVLVDYGNETAIANQVESALQRPVGLVSYGQRPYLMAEYSPDSAIAIATLRNLSRRGFQTILVDSQGVTVLTETVK